VPGWGVQLPSSRIEAEARELGAAAFEAGPLQFLGRARGRKVPAGFLFAPLDRSSHELVDRYAAYLASLRAQLLVVAPAGDAPGDHGHPELDARGWAALFDAVGGMAAIAHRHGLDLAIHPHFGSVLATHAELEHLLVGCEANLCVDVGDLLLCGIDPLELVELAPRRIRHVHLKDVQLDLATAVRTERHGYWEAVSKGLYPALGEGGARVGELLDLLLGQRYAGWITVEQEVALATEPPLGEGPAAAVGRSLKFLERALG
jgi:inosose dehydratase